MNLPAMLEAVMYMRNGQLGPEQTREVPEHSIYRSPPFNGKLYKPENLAKIKRIHRSSYDRQRYLLKRAEESIAFLLNENRQLKDQVATLTK